MDDDTDQKSPRPAGMVLLTLLAWLHEEKRREQQVRRLARQRLPLILDAAPRRRAAPKGEAAPGQQDPADDNQGDTGMAVDGHDPYTARRTEIRGKNDQRQAQARRRRRAAYPDEEPEPVILDAATVTTAPPKRQKGGLRKGAVRKREKNPLTTQDALLKRVVAVVPAYRQLVKLAMAADRDKGRFVKAYCRLLGANGKKGRGVSKQEKIDLAGSEPWLKGRDWAYDTLNWAYRLFADWAFEQYQAGHIFTEDELEPMQRWVQNMNPDDDTSAESGEAVDNSLAKTRTDVYSQDDKGA